jgi:hypothetical protein
LAILVVFLLSIWRSAPSLLPAFRRGSDHESSGTAVVALENERAGYIRLLRRAIPRKELLQVCIREWSLDSGMPVEALRTAAGVPASETQLVERFNDIARVVANANGSNGRPSVAPHSAASGVASDHNAQAAAIHG